MQDTVPATMMALLQDHSSVSKRNVVSDIVHEAFQRATHALQLVNDYHLDNQGMPMASRPKHDQACYPFATNACHVVPQIDTMQQRPCAVFNQLKELVQDTGLTVVRHLTAQMVSETLSPHADRALHILDTVAGGPLPNFAVASAQMMLAVEEIGRLDIASCQRDLNKRFPMPPLALPYCSSYAA